MELAVIIMVLVGIILVYAAIKNQDPRTLVKQALGKG
jgi:Na+-transporting methylmalonyl-CoA/oxaloacetate decarboxylase beta subunit